MGSPPRNHPLTARITVIAAMTVRLTLVARFALDFDVIPLSQLTGSSPREAPRPDSPTRGIRVRPVPASLDPSGFEAVIKPGTGFSNDKTGHRIQ
jgi:hypothetical protein